ncbi:Transmembrane transcriptional regulator (anti-sigma factor RsiW) [Gracilibacillus ureilyticus]|uniref:Anti-sigma-W factor RsiW n=1 Tax=Gracilibacillus ureilyticus TaxID=531814 RepID=A0A1H9N8B6_9BACI|nr:anti-sigma factor [Gracilibacillus ureilyticus]SER32138.1 Transmembrane transcriptional regulator (anti-sigma factor RsiW) [Gracilibacillus ureilyticus]
MKCNNEVIELMHQYLDGDITGNDEEALRSHLRSCEACQTHFRELKRTVALITTNVDLQPSADFTNKVMAQLPKEKKRSTVRRWVRIHPLVTAAAIFFILMSSSLLSFWNQDHQLSYPKGMNLVVENDTVIVPEGVTIENDLEIKNGNIKINGEVKGDVVIINGENLTASAGSVAGEIEQVDQMFGWLWYKLKNLTEEVFSFDE